MATKSKEKEKPEVFEDIPLGGDYALDANDNPVVVYEDRSMRGKKVSKPSVEAKKEAPKASEVKGK